MKRPQPWLLLVLALGFGTAAAYLALSYIRNQTTPLLSAEAPRGQVLLAVKDLPIGAVVGEQDVRTVEWPGDAIPPGFLSVPEEVVGRGVITPVKLNEPLLEGKLAPKGTGGGLPTIITEGMRALSVRVDEVIAVAGFVIPGTRVDVLLTKAVGGENVTRAILQNVQILAAGQSIQIDAEGKPQTVAVITVLLSPEQAEMLTLAANQGRIQMTLRNMLDTVRVVTPGARADALLRVGGRRTSRPRPRVSARAATVPRQTETIIEVFRGGQKTLTKFNN
jgi:pilus assembly protein CpaB